MKTSERDESLKGIAETLAAIKEKKENGYEKIGEFDEAIKGLIESQEKFDKLLAGDEDALDNQVKTWRPVFEKVMEDQLEQRFEAMQKKFDLNTNGRILSAIDRTGLTLEQKMLMTDRELGRYFPSEHTADITMLQHLWDEAMLVGHIMFWSKKNRGEKHGTLKEEVKASRAYQQWEAATRAMDTATTAEGLELVPTNFSAQILGVIAVTLKISATFASLTMPTSPFKLPVATSDDVGFKAPEQLTDSFLTEANKIGALTPATTNVTFTAQKPGALAVFSEEINEDAIIAIVPFLREKLGNSIGNAIERAVLDGDTAGTHQDNDVSSATDARKLWNGIRKDVDAPTNGVDLSTLNLSNLRGLRQAMTAAYAEDSETLTYAVSVASMLRFLDFTEFLTVDKFGPNATILRGQVGRIDNTPVLTSKYVRTDVAATGVNTSGGPNTKAIIILYSRNGYMIGQRRGVTIKFGESIWTDQGVLVATQRLDFEKTRGSNIVGAIGKNITP